MEQYLTVSGEQITEVLEDFAMCSEGLDIDLKNSIRICQKDDGKTIVIREEEVDEILVRKDQDGKVFLQINLLIGYKVLLTNMWVGFKPVIDEAILEKVPSVVTTPDLVSVFEALEESKRLGLLGETKTLRQVYMAILHGGERIGFNMSEERQWIQRLGISTSMAA